MTQVSKTAQTKVETESLQARKERLISLALLLMRAIEMLPSGNLFDDLEPNVSGGVDFYEEVTRFEVRLIEVGMRHVKGNQAQASALLGLNPTTLNSKLKRYKIDPQTFRA